MATISHTKTYIPDSHGAAWHVVWPAVNGNTSDVGDALEMPAWSDRSVQFSGSFGGATLVLQGSNDGTNWVTLQDLEGTAISTTGATLVSVMEITRYVRPSSSGGTGGAVDVDMIISGFKR